MALIAAAAVCGLGVFGLTQLQTDASGPTTPEQVSLVMQQPYTHAIESGADLRIRPAVGTMGSGSRVLLLAVGKDGAILAQETFFPSPAEERAGAMTVVAPAISGTAAYWVALAPVEGSQAMDLIVSPAGPRPPGTPLAAILRHVPPGDTVYLMGVHGADPGTQGAAIADYVPPTACSPNPSSYGMVICNFTAPEGYDTRVISFQAYTTGDPVNSPPVNNLPEVPAAAVLPLLILPALLLAGRTWRRGR